MSDRSCAVDDCRRQSKARGWCTTHYARWKRLGDPLAGGPPVPKPLRGSAQCSIDGCDKVSVARTYCRAHYSKWSRYGDALAGRTKPRFCQDGYTRPHSDGYTMIKTDGGWMLHHRFVIEQTLGRRLEDFENVHHINGRRSDNRPENLELWVKPQPNGQRAIDLARWVAVNYPDLVIEAKERR
jgi:hypothetical protein